MAIAGLESTSNLFGIRENSRNTESTAHNKQIDMNGFLNMFMTQLKNQDPTNPMESYELSAQLAQFSSVEKLSQINTNILKEMDCLTSVNYGQMTQLIGRDVIGLSDGIQLNEGEASKSSYELSVPASVTLEVFDENGALVRTIDAGTQESGSYDVEWDGRDNSGKTVPDGNYRVQVEAVDSDGNLIDVTQTVSGKIYAFSVDRNNPQFVLGGPHGAKLPVGAVTEVREAGGTGESESDE